MASVSVRSGSANLDEDIMEMDDLIEELQEEGDMLDSGK
jgi:hypothetical protein